MEEEIARSISRRSLIGAGFGGAAALMLGPWLAGCTVSPTIGPGALLPLPGGTGWKQYPNTFFGNPTFTFPQIEGQTGNQTDTWYVQGKLTGTNTGRQYAFLTIFVKNRIGGTIKFDFHTFAIFNLDGTDYGTYTAYDTDTFGPPLLSSRSGYLDLSFSNSIATSSWRTRIDNTNHLIPFAYDLNLNGFDANGNPMSLIATMDPQDRPAAVGGSDFGGIVTMQAQGGTGSYFQTGPVFNGVIVYDGELEPVTGTIGHIDRQFFPNYAGVNAGPNSRNFSHEWRSLHLDDNSTVSIWRQYSRQFRNAVVPFTGATRFTPATEVTDFDPTFTETVTSYVKYPATFSTVVPPVSPNRYMPSAHNFQIPGWDLQLTGVPITPVPVHGLPIEYMSGPVNYTGTLGGQPITAFGSYERSLALYRNWELLEVLRVTVTNLPNAAFQPGGATRADLQVATDQVGAAYDANNPSAGNQIIDTVLSPAVATLAPASQPFLVELLADTKAAPAN